MKAVWRGMTSVWSKMICTQDRVTVKYGTSMTSYDMQGGQGHRVTMMHMLDRDTREDGASTIGWKTVYGNVKTKQNNLIWRFNFNNLGSCQPPQLSQNHLVWCTLWNNKQPNNVTSWNRSTHSLESLGQWPITLQWLWQSLGQLWLSHNGYLSHWDNYDCLTMTLTVTGTIMITPQWQCQSLGQLWLPYNDWQSLGQLWLPHSDYVSHWDNYDYYAMPISWHYLAQESCYCLTNSCCWRTTFHADSSIAQNI